MAAYEQVVGHAFLRPRVEGILGSGRAQPDALDVQARAGQHRLFREYHFRTTKAELKMPARASHVRKCFRDHSVFIERSRA